MSINRDKPDLWKNDILQSVDLYNRWFMEFAPKAFRDTRITTACRVEKALIDTTIQGKDVPNTSLGYTTGSHWTTTDYKWNSGDVQHFALEGDRAAHPAKSLTQENAMIFERAPQAASSEKKDFTHIVVAGRYTLTPTDESNKLPEDFDGTFWTYGTTNGVPNVYLTETAVKKAMGSENGSLVPQVTTQGGMTTHYTMGTETCIKYAKGYVYYAAEVETIIGTQLIGKGVVRNHDYKVTVKSISGWGTAICDPNEPIVPEDKKEDGSSYLKLNIVVNPWQHVADQDINWE